ncbi:MAG: hypothetical protein K9K66_17270 [Desulfarculaceae bacterium]|nr:hypothetical protein [Desulfarculaceae bacterium]MCF8071460.1 hypothetical protein [Desulfarculaceae bacterium]MCF8103412.1 hypothetical protein [Desulfarculaceae bacterium]MCF8118181.1 hypothetical protein [Desulfarculaceae bacterium]
MARQERASVELGGGVVELTPLEPGVWEPLAAREPGPASLCLALLERAGPCWRGGTEATGEVAEPLPLDPARLPAAAAAPLLARLRAPWLSQAQEEALAGLRHYLEVRADFPGLDCAACLRQHRAGEGAPDCAVCPLPPLPAQGWEALRLAALLRSLPPRAGALLAGLLSGRSPSDLRLLLSALGLMRSHLEPLSGSPARNGVLE